MANFLSQLTKSERARLLEELNYLNLDEIRGFFGARDSLQDRGRVLEVGQPTRISVQIVREENPPARLGSRDRLYYRWYAKEFEGVMRLLRDLTAGRFRDGAVCWDGPRPSWDCRSARRDPAA